MKNLENRIYHLKWQCENCGEVSTYHINPMVPACTRCQSQNIKGLEVRIIGPFDDQELEFLK